jgi:hypothetical protein
MATAKRKLSGVLWAGAALIAAATYAAGASAGDRFVIYQTYDDIADQYNSFSGNGNGNNGFGNGGGDGSPNGRNDANR